MRVSHRAQYVRT